MPAVAITEYTDPGCPFAFSAEPHRWRLRWLFGEQVTWELRMVVLAAERADYAAKGFTPERAAQGAKALHDRFGMPMGEEEKPVAATEPACRAVVAARLHAPGQEWLLLRALRHRNFAGGLLDDPALIACAATDAGLDPGALAGWTTEPAVDEALREDMRLARAPTPAALALKDKLATTPDGGWRYTCPSYEFAGSGDAAFSAPGMQTALTYETALANVEPRLERRDAPADVGEVLAWAEVPLATQEVAEVCGLTREVAREQLEAAGAVTEPVGRDAFWSLAA